MSRPKLYLVKEETSGFDITGPNDHTWHLKKTEGWTKALAMSMTLSEAYRNGQASILDDTNLAELLDILTAPDNLGVGRERIIKMVETIKAQLFSNQRPKRRRRTPQA